MTHGSNYDPPEVTRLAQLHNSSTAFATFISDCFKNIEEALCILITEKEWQSILK